MGELRVYVLDTTAFIARWPLHAPPGAQLYTTSLVVGEVRDSDSLGGLGLAASVGRVHVSDPSPGAVEWARKHALRHGLHVALSETDLSVLALAWELGRHRARPVVVVTDDYALQNAVKLAGFEFMPLRTRGISRVERGYVAFCPACGYVSHDPGERTCPVCGTPLKTGRRRRGGRQRGRRRRAMK
jgi:UPF0271 protein